MTNNKILDFINKWKPYYKEIKDMKDSHYKNIGFNIFKIISDRYYREDFHSNIIYQILNKNDRFLKLFINMLNMKIEGKKIKPNDFSDSKIKIESGIEGKRRIDILIYNEETKKAIIIENKINNAIDQKRQIPDYYCHTAKQFEVVAVVYIPLLGNKKPVLDKWTNEEIDKIDDKIVTIPAFSTNGINLSEHWINPCILASNEINFISTLKQYTDLIIDLSKNKLMTNKGKEFYELVLGKNKDIIDYNTALSIRDMVNQLSEYRVERIKEKFENKENAKIFRNKSHFYNKDLKVWVCKFENYKDNNFDLWLRIESREDHYIITLSEGKTFKEGQMDKLENFIKSKKLESYFIKKNKDNEWHAKVFCFPNYDDELDIQIQEILKNLNKE